MMMKEHSFKEIKIMKLILPYFSIIINSYYINIRVIKCKKIYRFYDRYVLILTCHVLFSNVLYYQYILKRIAPRKISVADSFISYR